MQAAGAVSLHMSLKDTYEHHNLIDEFLAVVNDSAVKIRAESLHCVCSIF